jgi:hypothetical protein
MSFRIIFILCCVVFLNLSALDFFVDKDEKERYDDISKNLKEITNTINDPWKEKVLAESKDDKKNEDDDLDYRINY